MCNVLVLDGDPTYLRVWEKILQKIPDCTYKITGNSETAIGLIQAKKIDLIISGVVLPKSDGYTIAKIARKFHPKSKIILTTAYDCDLSRFDLKNPDFSILYKPYDDLENIERLIRHTLNNDRHFDDLSDDSFSENEDYPKVIEWKL